jgi:hydrogenase nickel incorporation protein HypA/HybF
MHEMALAEGILAVALDVADGQPVRRIRLRVGALQHVTPDALGFCFQLAAEGTPAAEASLEVVQTGASLRCSRCGVVSAFEPPLFACRACGSSEVRVESGDEVLVDGVELDGGWLYRPDAAAGESVAAGVPAEHLAEHARQDAERQTAARPVE